MENILITCLGDEGVIKPHESVWWHIEFFEFILRCEKSIDVLGDDIFTKKKIFPFLIQRLINDEADTKNCLVFKNLVKIYQPSVYYHPIWEFSTFSNWWMCPEIWQFLELGNNLVSNYNDKIVNIFPKFYWYWENLLWSSHLKL